MNNEDATDPGMEKLPDGTIIIGPASVRAQIKKQSAEAIDYAKTVVDKINDETEKPGDSEYIEAP